MLLCLVYPELHCTADYVVSAFVSYTSVERERERESSWEFRLAGLLLNILFPSADALTVQVVACSS